MSNDEAFEQHPGLLKRLLVAAHDEQMARDVALSRANQAWAQFGQIEGTHFGIRVSDRRELLVMERGASGDVFAEMEGVHRRRPHWPNRYRSVRVAGGEPGGTVYRQDRTDGSDAYFVDPSGETVLWSESHHWRQAPRGVIHILSTLEGYEHSNPRLVFPVRYAVGGKPTMTGVDQNGEVILGFRYGPDGPDIILTPDLKPQPLLILAGILASRWLFTYFEGDKASDRLRPISLV